MSGQIVRMEQVSMVRQHGRESLWLKALGAVGWWMVSGGLIVVPRGRAADPKRLHIDANGIGNGDEFEMHLVKGLGVAEDEVTDVAKQVHAMVAAEMERRGKAL